MISGALLTTANSSGDCLVSPAALRMDSQADSDARARPSTAHPTRLRERLLHIGCSRAWRVHGSMLWPQQRVIQQRANPEGDGAIRDVEHIPIVALVVKVKKVG